MSSDGGPVASGDMLVRAMLALQIADRDQRVVGGEARRSEVVLAEAGISLSEIAALTGREYDVVKGVARRGREAEAKAAAAAKSKTKSSRKRGEADG